MTEEEKNKVRQSKSSFSDIVEGLRKKTVRIDDLDPRLLDTFNEFQKKQK